MSARWSRWRARPRRRAPRPVQVEARHQREHRRARRPAVVAVPLGRVDRACRRRCGASPAGDRLTRRPVSVVGSATVKKSFGNGRRQAAGSMGSQPAPGRGGPGLRLGRRQAAGDEEDEQEDDEPGAPHPALFDAGGWVSCPTPASLTSSDSACRPWSVRAIAGARPGPYRRRRNRGRILDMTFTPIAPTIHVPPTRDRGRHLRDPPGAAGARRAVVRLPQLDGDPRRGADDRRHRHARQPGAVAQRRVLARRARGRPLGLPLARRRRPQRQPRRR